MVARGKLGVDLFQDNSNHTSQSCSVAPNEDHLNDGPQYFFFIIYNKNNPGVNHHHHSWAHSFKVPFS